MSSFLSAEKSATGKCHALKSLLAIKTFYETFSNPYANVVQFRVKPQPVSQLPLFLPLSFIYLLWQLNPNSFLMKPNFSEVFNMRKNQ